MSVIPVPVPVPVPVPAQHVEHPLWFQVLFVVCVLVMLIGIFLITMKVFSVYEAWLKGFEDNGGD